MKIKLIVFMITGLAFFQCSKHGQNKTTIDYFDTLEFNQLKKISYQNNCDSYPNPVTQNPIEFLASLKFNDCENIYYYTFHPDEFPKDWVKPIHIPILVELLNSDEVAYPVASMYASISLIKRGYTTIGMHAYFIIRHFQGTVYPPYSTFGKFETDTLKLEEVQKNTILKWYSKHINMFYAE